MYRNPHPKSVHRMRTGVCREFRSADGGEIGDIWISWLPDHRLDVLVQGLHENGWADEPLDYPCCQGDLVVKYDPSLSIYSVIYSVLDTLTQDHAPRTSPERGATFQDWVVTEDRSLPFTSETVNHLTMDTGPPCKYSGDVITLHGNIDAEGKFTYDAPIVSRGSSRRYYELTRGKKVWDVTYQELYPDPPRPQTPINPMNV